jgi:F0F1-type ATP synthase epsilon subunit
VLLVILVGSIIHTQRDQRETETNENEPEKNDFFFNFFLFSSFVVVNSTSLARLCEGVTADHVATVAELKPGLVTVTSSQGNEEHFFVSGGFAFVHSNSSVDISVLEAVNVDQLDPVRVKNGLDSFAKKAAGGGSESEVTKAQIGLEVHEAMNYALSHAQSR